MIDIGVLTRDAHRHLLSTNDTHKKWLIREMGKKFEGLCVIKNGKEVNPGGGNCIIIKKGKREYQYIGYGLSINVMLPQTLHRISSEIENLLSYRRMLLSAGLSDILMYKSEAYMKIRSDSKIYGVNILSKILLDLICYSGFNDDKDRFNKRVRKLSAAHKIHPLEFKMDYGYLIPCTWHLLLQGNDLKIFKPGIPHSIEIFCKIDRDKFEEKINLIADKKQKQQNEH